MSFKINKNEKFGCQNTVSKSSFTESMKIVFSYEVILRIQKLYMQLLAIDRHSNTHIRII